MPVAASRARTACAGGWSSACGFLRADSVARPRPRGQAGRCRAFDQLRLWFSSCARGDMKSAQAPAGAADPNTPPGDSSGTPGGRRNAVQEPPHRVAGERPQQLPAPPHQGGGTSLSAKPSALAGSSSLAWLTADPVASDVAFAELLAWTIRPRASTLPIVCPFRSSARSSSEVALTVHCTPYSPGHHPHRTAFGPKSR